MECEKCGWDYKLKIAKIQKPLCQKCKNIYNRAITKYRSGRREATRESAREILDEYLQRYDY